MVTARTYCEAHPEANVAIIESADSLGGTWAKHRLYPGLKTNNLLGTYEFPDFPMHSHEFSVAPWQHIPGTSLHQYLVAFSKHYDITRRIRFNTKVDVVEQGDSDDWVLTLQEKDKPTKVQLRAAKLVVATGMTGNPNMPALPGAEEFDAPIFHGKDFLQHSDLLKTAKRVVVYGGAKSAWDAVYAYATNGVTVDWVIRESGKGPCWMASLFATPFKISIERLIFTRVITWMTPCIWGASDGYEDVKNFLHTTAWGRWIVSMFFKGIADDTLANNDFDAHPETAKLKPWSDAFWSGTSLSMLNYPTDFFRYVRSGQVKVHHGDITHVTPHTVHLSNGNSLITDALHCATGWKHESPINLSPASLTADLGLPHVGSVASSEAVVEADDEILARFPMLKDQPDIYPKNRTQDHRPIEAASAPTPYRLFRFMIPPKNIHKRNFAVAGAMLSIGQTLSAQFQALWITSYLDGTLNVPESVEEVEHSTELFVQYGKWRTPSGCGPKHGDMIFETMPYWDQLLQDLGLAYKRKKSWIQEIFLPYGVSDYNGIVNEWIQLKREGKLAGGCGTALHGKTSRHSIENGVNGDSRKNKVA